MINRRRILTGGAGAAMGLAGMGLSGAARAQSKMVMKAADVHPLGYPTVEAVVRIGKKLEAATSGRLSVQMYPAMQLGGEKEMIEQAQVGALQFARISVGPVGTIVDDLNVFNLPFVFRSEAHMRKVIDGEIGTELLAKVSTNARTNLIALCWMDAGSRNIYTHKAIRKPDDLKGLKIRMMGNPIFVDTMNAMGGNGISMGFDQLYNAMQTKVVDGAENNPPTFMVQNHFQVAKFFSMTEHLIIPEILVFSRRTWDQLSKDDQALVQKFAAEAQQEQRKLWDDKVKEALDKMKEAGITLVTDIDKKAFQDSVKPVWDKYGAKYAALIKRIDAVS
ncbi:TRAP transporter substrate-binding protein [Vineibacter terrae]|uniref:TRAP transporter substrate-binding protein n=1 Tax=Vineibacter terrae TaxID=2586908 RepID=UPI002E34C09B|nr:TRAP transporter substrate-binding protein [Vineibacter terrae]HEX2886022.1 TRAP transporter substrate-binding protein [Vineibacter terrae]